MGDQDTQTTLPTVPTHSKEEIACLSDEIYERHIRAQVEPAHHGKIVSIDVDSGKRALAEDILEAVDRLRAWFQEAIVVWSLRVGYRAVHNFGGRSLATDQRSWGL